MTMTIEEICKECGKTLKDIKAVWVDGNTLKVYFIVPGDYLPSPSPYSLPHPGDNPYYVHPVVPSQPFPPTPYIPPAIPMQPWPSPSYPSPTYPDPRWVGPTCENVDEHIQG